MRPASTLCTVLKDTSNPNPNAAPHTRRPRPARPPPPPHPPQKAHPPAPCAPFSKTPPTPTPTPPPIRVAPPRRSPGFAGYCVLYVVVEGGRVCGRATRGRVSEGLGRPPLRNWSGWLEGWSWRGGRLTGGVSPG